MVINPFQNTKATYFEDEEIVRYWVDKNYEYIKNNIMLPESSIPVFILGGKGIGKTHILRYFSFQTQKIRAKNEKSSYLDYILKEKYIGVYIVSNSLSTHRFSGRGLPPDEWERIFYYYINLELTEKVTKKIIKIFEDDPLLKIKIKFDCIFSQYPNELLLNDFYELIRQKRIDIDERVCKLGMPGSNTNIMDDINPIFSIEDSCFMLINNVLTHFEKLKKIDILIILDEYENLNKNQQKYFNTLLRHPSKEKRIKLRIAGRLYALKTRSTLDAEEQLLNDSEVRFENLDDLYQDDFKGFSTTLYRKRIEDDSDVDFGSSFEDINQYNDNILLELNNKISDGHPKKHLEQFEKDLTSKYSKEQIRIIIDNISNPDLLIEKTNCFLCYKHFNKDLIVYSEEVIKDKLKNNDYDLQKTQLEKFKDDMICQLFKDYRKDYAYGGYNSIIKMSNNNPRILLSILNNIHFSCRSNKIDMFKDKNIPVKYQHLAILKTSEWFWNNFTEDVKDQKIIWAVESLCGFLREARFSSKPSEKTLISFSYDEKHISKEVNNLIKLAVNHNLLIEGKNKKRKDKNKAALNRQLRIHPMLSPKWDLPLVVGGTMSFSKDEITALFLKKEKDWEKYKKERLKTLNPVNKDDSEYLKLFEEDF